MFVEKPLLRVVKLVPLPEITEDLLVLARQVGAVDPIVVSNRIYAFRRFVNLLLLKKPRTPGSGESLPLPVRSRR